MREVTIHFTYNEIIGVSGAPVYSVQSDENVFIGRIKSEEPSAKNISVTVNQAEIK